MDFILCEAPADRLDDKGPSALSDSELLSILLKGSKRTEQDFILSNRLLKESGSLANLLSWDTERFIGFGLRAGKAAQFVSALEIARRIGTQNTEENPMLNRADKVRDFMEPVAGHLEVEKFWVLTLNRKNRLIKRHQITSGTATCTLAHPREVFRCAIRDNATAIVCVHNHPSGDPAPSSHDITITRTLREAAKAVDIELIDHVVVGRASADPLGRGYYSFREAGLI